MSADLHVDSEGEAREAVQRARLDTGGGDGAPLRGSGATSRRGPRRTGSGAARWYRRECVLIFMLICLCHMTLYLPIC